MKINIVHKVLIFFSFILAVNVIVGFFIFQSRKKLNESEQWVKHSEQVISQSDKILKLGIDLETSARGFTITNDSSFLEPMHSAEKVIFSNIGNLRQLTLDNPGQEKRLDSLTFYIHKRLEFSLQSVDLRSKKGLAAAIVYISSKKGKYYTDRIRQITNDIQNEEHTLLNQRAQISDRFAAIFNWVLLGMFLLITVFTILLLIATIKNSFHSREKEKRAAELLIALEEIKSQSDEIAAQNEEYQQINEELNLTNFELIEAKDKAEESDRLKSAFLANMSHEIRTPMNGILGFANLLKEKDITIEDQHEFINIIKDSGARMLNIINDIIDISKIESGIMKVNTTETNINDQIEYIYNFFKPEVKEKGMHLLYNIDLSSKEANIKTDKEKIYAILINLVKNAIKYSEKGSIEFGYTKKGDFLEFYVKDTGIGISKGMQKAVFDRFIQAEFVDHQAIQGAGLGLSISKAYVGMLGGEIWVESEVGIGSIFYFTIPYDFAPINIMDLKDAFIPVKADNITKKLKILIVEDDSTSEKLITRMVLKYCKEDLHARTGKEAVEICRNNRDLDFVLMDIQMPDMNGYEATRQIRQFNKDVIIIAQTAFGLSGDKEKSIAAGCNYYLSKPIDKDSLIDLIKRYSD